MTPKEQFIKHIEFVDKPIKCVEVRFEMYLESEVKYTKATFTSPEGEEDIVEMPYRESKNVKIKSILPQNYTEEDYHDFLESIYVDTSEWLYDRIDEIFGTIWFEDGSWSSAFMIWEGNDGWTHYSVPNLSEDLLLVLPDQKLTTKTETETEKEFL